MVRKTGIIFFMATALILILSHSILPHIHRQSDCRAHRFSIRKTLTLSDIIRNTLSRDLGAHHLEEFYKAKGAVLSFDYGGSSMIQTNFYLRNINNSSIGDQKSIINAGNTRFDFSPSISRAPPVDL